LPMPPLGDGTVTLIHLLVEKPAVSERSTISRGQQCRFVEQFSFRPNRPAQN
jgi:hypothetical protein